MSVPSTLSIGFRMDGLRLSDGTWVRGRWVKPSLSLPAIRGLHSSTFRLNVSTFYGVRWVI